jgi:hypothetical protein
MIAKQSTRRDRKPQTGIRRNRGAETNIRIRSKECLHLQGMVAMVVVTGNKKAMKFSNFQEQTEGHFEDGWHN